MQFVKYTEKDIFWIRCQKCKELVQMDKSLAETKTERIYSVKCPDCKREIRIWKRDINVGKFRCNVCDKTYGILKS